MRACRSIITIRLIPVTGQFFSSLSPPLHLTCSPIKTLSADTCVIAINRRGRERGSFDPIVCSKTGEIIFTSLSPCIEPFIEFYSEITVSIVRWNSLVKLYFDAHGFPPLLLRSALVVFFFFFIPTRRSRRPRAIFHGSPPP